MRVVKQIRPAPGKRAVVVLSDGKEINLSLEQVVKQGVKIGQSLDEQQVQDLVKQGQASYWYQQAVKLISRRPRSVREMRDWLAKKKLPESLSQQIIARLQQRHWLDDLEFARWWVEQRQLFRPKGRPVLQAELRQKGVAADIIAQALADLPEPTEVIEQLARRRWPSVKQLEPPVARRRLIAFLLRRGFSYAVVRRVVDELLRSEYTKV